MPCFGALMRLHITLFFGISVCIPALSFAEPSLAPPDPAFVQAVEQVVERYLRSNPEIIEQMLLTLKAKREAKDQARVRNAILSRQDALLHDPQSPVSGNLEGDVAIVEFFDYRCTYCKRVADAVSRLQQEDPDVRVVYKDYPILGEASELAARAALASKAQGNHLDFHEALLASEQELTEERVFAIATEVGLDPARLRTDMESPSIQSTIDRNRSLARELGIKGTPGFIIGTEIIPGAVALKELKHFVRQVREERK